LPIMTSHHLNFHDPRPKHTQVIVRKHPSILKLLSWNGLSILGHCDLDFWTIDPKINKGQLLMMTNLSINFYDPGCSQLTTRKRFYHCGSLRAWPLTYWLQNQ
jgi:hypothetical protein